ncbi:MAG: serine protease [Candidatus Paceibacterota bacterium]|nr:MAG: serine protease [Candidatus Paceibacterota bacterium]
MHPFIQKLRETRSRWLATSWDIRMAVFYTLLLVVIIIFSDNERTGLEDFLSVGVPFLICTAGLVIQGYRVGEEYEWSESLSRKQRPLLLLGMLCGFAGLLALSFIDYPETPQWRYVLLNITTALIFSTAWFMFGFLTPFGFKLFADYGGDAFLERLMQRKWLPRPIILLRIVSAIVLLMLVAGAWLAYTTLERLADIERALGGREALQCSAQDTIAEAGPSVVRIIGAFGEGSGFAVKEHFILTNYHVIDGEPSPKIVYADGSFEAGIIVDGHPGLDLALISVERNMRPLPWEAWQNAQLGQQLFILGYPYGGSLNGEVTVNRATISAFRGNKAGERHYLQTDGGLVEGMSGGPMITFCGRVVGINAAGGESLSIGISTDIAREWVDESLRIGTSVPWDNPDKDINPNASPIDTVRAYYHYISARNYEAAFALLSSHFIGRVTYADWVVGFETQLQTAVYHITADPKNHSRVFVELESTDLIDGDIVYRSFVGSWTVRSVGGQLRLWESNIQEVYDE